MTLGWIDVTVIAFYFAATIAIGLWFGRGERNTKDFFLGGRRQHWLLAGISIIATEVSAITVIAVPAEAFKGDWSYLQMYAGSFLGRILIIVLLLPAFYRGNVTTVYEYLGQRFGGCTRTTATFMFFGSRILGSGIRLLVASLAISVMFGWPLLWVVIATTGIAMVYATFGGIKAILWTDAFQATLYLGATVGAVFFLFHCIPGSAYEDFSNMYHSGKLHTVTWASDPNNPKNFWVLAIHATFITMAAMGTDQDLTQRMLTCPDIKQSQRSLLFNAFAGLPIVCTFLLIGSLLWAYYQVHSPPPPDIAANERIFPYFLAHELPANVGARGLMVTAIFAVAMGSLSSAIGALASTAVTDLYRPFMVRDGSERHYLSVARLFTVFFGVLLTLVAMAFANDADLLWKVFQWVGLVFGGMLGIFLLGVTTKTRGNDRINATVMISSTLLLMALKRYQETPGHKVDIAWPWWVVIGTGWTYVVAGSFRTKPEARTNTVTIVD